jgi:phospholipid/cholesterol/gamma-HCH transport system ATP-binding protein
MPGPIALQLKNVSLELEGRLLFDQVNLEVSTGTITALMGPSGVGKTTLLRLFSGQIKPTSGEVFVLGQNINRLSDAQLNKLRRSIGYLFQQGALFSDLNVFENVAFGLREHTQLTEEMIRDQVLMRLQAVGLRGACHLSVSQLSGGMARRVAIARSIALDPAMIFYDEPFAGQDPINSGIVLRLIKILNKSLGITSVIVSHEINHVIAIADTVHVLSAGHVIASGDPTELFQSEAPAVKQFVHGLPDGPIAFEYPARPAREDFLHG